MIIRQGDVLLISGAALPKGCVLVPPDRGRVVLAYGEVTGHAHAIDLESAEQIVSAAISSAQAYARLWAAPDGSRYLEVSGAPVTLSHEEHTAHQLPVGIYQLPTQVEYTPSALRRVED